jgi:hypothetical protein
MGVSNEKLRLARMGDVEFVALQGYCNECKQHVALEMTILYYYRQLAFAHNALDGLLAFRIITAMQKI